MSEVTTVQGEKKKGQGKKGDPAVNGVSPRALQGLDRGHRSAPMPAANGESAKPT